MVSLSYLREIWKYLLKQVSKACRCTVTVLKRIKATKRWESFWWRRQVYFTLLFFTLPATLMVHCKRDLLYRNTGRHVKKSSKSWKRIKIQRLTVRQNSSIYNSKPVKHFHLFFGEYGKFELSTRDLKIFALASFQSLSMYRNCAQESQSIVWKQAGGVL